MLTAFWKGHLQNSKWLMLAMFLLLHSVVMLGLYSAWAAPLLLGHIGLFLMWQPLWRGEREVGWGTTIFIAFIVATVVFWLNWWTITFWLISLFGLAGARVFVFRHRGTRLSYLLMLLYLLILLLLWVVPNMFTAQPEMIQAGQTMIYYALPSLLVLMALLPMRAESSNGEQAVDFIYSLLLFLLLTLVVLGSLAFMLLGHLSYPEALLRTLFLLGLVLLVFGLLWNPRFGLGNLQVQFSRYLLNVGTPLEGWLGKLAEAAQYEQEATAYLRRAVTLLADFPWLSGLTWEDAKENGRYGQPSKHSVEVQEGSLRVTLYSRQPLNPALLLHINLLVKLVAYVYQAKQREQTLRDITRLQAVYETGARLTHDLKNMLQSLLSLTAIAQHADDRAQQLLKQQLPLIVQRIEMTLNKLEQPEVDGESAQLELSAWWEGLRSRNEQVDIEWHVPDRLPDIKIPSALFDCVIDNLLDNAIRKRQSDPSIQVIVDIQLEPLSLAVTDTGMPVPAKLAGKLLHGVVVSDGGLGIGLYQSARWAEQLGYRLVLGNNQAGKIRFELQQAR